MTVHVAQAKHFTFVQAVRPNLRGKYYAKTCVMLNAPVAFRVSLHTLFNLIL